MNNSNLYKTRHFNIGPVCMIFRDLYSERKKIYIKKRFL